MPWIDNDMRTAIAARLRDVHGFTDVSVGRVHFCPGPGATRENVIEQLADSMAEIEFKRRAGRLCDDPPRTHRAAVSLKDVIDNQS